MNQIQDIVDAIKRELGASPSEMFTTAPSSLLRDAVRALDETQAESRPAPRFAVGDVLEDGDTVTDVTWQPEHSRYWVTTRRNGQPFSGGPEWFHSYGAHQPPAFKPLEVPDKYRDVWEKIEVAPDFLADLYVLKISAHQTQSGDSASTGSLKITWQQARRILEMLSSEDTER